MAASEWYGYYRSKTSAELVTAIAALEAKLDSGFSSQQIGSKAYTRDLGLIQDRLQAATYIQRERAAASGGQNPNVGGVDFSTLSV